VGLKLITPPNVTPISIVGMDALKQHLQEATDISDDDELITSFLNAAWQLAEAHTWRQFLTAEYRLTLQDFTAQSTHRRYGRRQSPILIPKPPCQSIDSVRYLDGDGVGVTMVENDDYIVDLESDICTIRPAYGNYWPNVRANLSLIHI